MRKVLSEVALECSQQTNKHRRDQIVGYFCLFIFNNIVYTFEMSFKVQLLFFFIFEDFYCQVLLKKILFFYDKIYNIFCAIDKF